jgi:hypothetical protein
MVTQTEEEKRKRTIACGPLGSGGNLVVTVLDARFMLFLIVWFTDEEVSITLFLPFQHKIWQ